MARGLKTPQDLDLVTVADFYRIIPDGQKADLIDGVIHVASPDSSRSNRLAVFIATLLEVYNSAKGVGGMVFADRFAFELSKLRAPEPDVAYVRPDRLHLLTATRMKGGPDIAVEIVAHESRERDYGEKARIYQDAGVSEYWIVDPIQKRVEFHLLERGLYRLATLEDNSVFRSTVLPGFWLDVSWLLADPLPDTYQCLQQLLGTP